MQHDAAAVFYGGYDQVGRLRPTRLHLSRIALAVVVAGIVLIAFVAADVAALENPPPLVRVTSVNWVVLDSLLAASAGFTLHPTQSTELSETCNGFCFTIDSVSVSAPFTLVSDTIVNSPVQWVNLTVQAPSTSYDGNLTITLEIP